VVLTKTMAKFLQETEGKKPVDYKEYGSKYVQHRVYLNRIQKRIERELSMLLWLAQNRPDILLKKPCFNDYGHVRGRKSKYSSGNERIRKIMLTVKALIGTKDVELFLDFDKISRSESGG
jgi:hypothetical protein